MKCFQLLFSNLQYSSEVDGQCTRKTFARFSRLRNKAFVKACPKCTFIVIQRSQLALFCIVSENLGFLSQNAAIEASNQDVHISTPKDAMAAVPIKR